MDISVMLKDDYRINIRAAAIIIHNNKILMHKDSRDDFYAVLGGRVELGEDSRQTIKREIFEELGKEIEIQEYVATIENFFSNEKYKTHEIQFIYKVEFIDEADKNIIDTIKNMEGKDYIQYEWLDLTKIEQYEIKPKVVKEMLAKNRYPTHMIQRD